MIAPKKQMEVEHYYSTIRKRHASLFDHLMRRKVSENIVTMRKISSRREIMLDGLKLGPEEILSMELIHNIRD